MMARGSMRGARWEFARRLALNRARWRCERCHGPGRLEVHHRVALAAGGDPWDPLNLEVLCRRCHLEHHAGPRGADAPPGRKRWRERLREMMVEDGFLG